jgi:hypothetical protein
MVSAKTSSSQGEGWQQAPLSLLTTQSVSAAHPLGDALRACADAVAMGGALIAALAVGALAVEAGGLAMSEVAPPVQAVSITENASVRFMGSLLSSENGSGRDHDARRRA